MSAKRNEPRLIARPWNPDMLRQPEPPPRSPVRSYGQLVHAEGLNLDWPELRLGDRGLSVADVRFAGLELRALNATVGAEGAYLKDSKQPVSVIEYVGSRLIAARMGAQYVPTTAADFSAIPVEKSSANLQWLTEGNPPDETVDNTFGSISPTLKWGVVYVGITRQLSIVTGGLSDRLAARSHFGAIARGIDHAVFHGGGGAEPLGIINVPGVGSVAGATFSVAKAAAMLRAVEDGNADSANVVWSMDPASAELLRKREAATGSGFLIDANGNMLGRPVHVSNSIDAGTIFCGDFTQAVVMVKDIELLIDKSTGSISGLTNVLAYPFMDVVVTRPSCFSVATGTT